MYACVHVCMCAQASNALALLSAERIYSPATPTPPQLSDSLQWSASAVLSTTSAVGCCWLLSFCKSFNTLFYIYLLLHIVIVIGTNISRSTTTFLLFQSSLSLHSISFCLLHILSPPLLIVTFFHSFRSFVLPPPSLGLFSFIFYILLPIITLHFSYCVTMATIFVSSPSMSYETSCHFSLLYVVHYNTCSNFATMMTVQLQRLLRVP